MDNSRNVQLSFPELTPERRRTLITEGVEALTPIVVDAYLARDWEHFGYDSWGAYLEGEFGMSMKLPRDARIEAVHEMRASGLSQRAIAEAVDVGQTTVRRDLEPGEPNGSPEAVVGLDGKMYPASVVSAELDAEWNHAAEHRKRAAKRMSPTFKAIAEVSTRMAGLSGWRGQVRLDEVPAAEEEIAFIVQEARRL